MNIEVSQVIVQIFAFLVMLWVLKKFGWKPLLNMLEERKLRIQSEFNNIEMKKEEIKNLTEEYQERLHRIDSEARLKIQEAIQEGRRIALDIQKEAQDNARELISKAKGEVEKEVVKARNQLKNDIVNITLSVTEKLIHERLDDAKHKKLITEFIEEAELK